MDTKGPRILLAGAFLFLLMGYSGIKYLYDSGLPPNTPTLSILGFCGLVAFTYLTGSGGNAGLVSAVNATAKTFPDQAVRGHTTFFCFGCPCSLFINHISAGIYHRFGYQWFWIICFFLLQHIPLVICGEHLGPSPAAGSWHVTSYDRGVFLRSTHPVARAGGL